jgi:anti-sigma regulatory factor (Ser/Thr protein kinase)
MLDQTASANGDSSLLGGAVSTSRGSGPLDDGELVEVPIVLDPQAPGAARTIVAQCLEERVVASALDSARLLVSELVSNSLRHSGGPAGDQVVVSVELMPDWFRVGVHDSGSNTVIRARPAGVDTSGGFGLNLVQLLSERWGVERLATGGTQVWVQLAREAG